MTINEFQREMNVNISVEMSIKGVPEEVVLLWQNGLPDCLKIIRELK